MCAADCTADHRRRDDKQLQVPSSTGLAAGIWMNLLSLAGSSGRSPPTSCLATPSAALVAATSAKTRTCMRALADPDSLWVLDMQVRVDRAPGIDGSAHRDLPSQQLRRRSAVPVQCGRPAARCASMITLSDPIACETPLAGHCTYVLRVPPHSSRSFLCSKESESSALHLAGTTYDVTMATVNLAGQVQVREKHKHYTHRGICTC